jgi:hypothetical protein
VLAESLSYEKFGRKRKRELFLEEMNAVVPWGTLLSPADRRQIIV